MELFGHIRVVLGIILSLSIARLLAGVARIVQHPGHKPAYWVHLAWALSLFLALLHLWWWESRLATVAAWSFLRFLFLVGFVTVYYFLCALLFPEQMDDYRDYRAYFDSRRGWFFGALALAYALDVGDTLLKGTSYLQGFGAEYLVRNCGYVVLCVLAMRVRSGTFHAVFAVANLAYQVSWILRVYEVLGPVPAPR